MNNAAQPDSGSAVGLAAAPPILDLRHISKTYTTVPVLLDVDLQASSGEVLGFLGANGAGKSTLLKIISGVVDATSGSMSIKGQEIDLAHYGPRDAAALGIHTVHQELSIFSNLSVADNFGMALFGQGSVSRRALRTMATQALGEIFPGNGIAPGAETGLLTLAERQMVEIAIAASRPDLSILILDEPTSALPASRSEQLHDYLRELSARGVLVIYVTHKLDEILTIADRLTVLRDGEARWQGPAQSTSRQELLVNLGARGGVEDAPSAASQASGVAVDQSVLVSVRDKVARSEDAVDFVVRTGEVVGIAGLEGAGQRPLLRQLYGSAGRRRAAFRIDGGISYVSGDRKFEGIFGLWDIAQNLIIASLNRLTRGGLISARASDALASEWYDTLHIKADGLDAPITSLSGGNQQKVIIARAFASQSATVILDDPTRGVDIDTKNEFYGLLTRLKSDGRSAVLYSTEDREFEQCDRVYVMADGAIVHELVGADINRENIIHWSYAGDDTRAIPSELAARRARPSQTRSFFSGIARSRLTLVLAFLAVILIAMGILELKSLGGVGLSLLLQPALVIVLAALAQMFIVAAGDFDLGIGYAIGFASVISATALVDIPWVGALLLLAVVGGYALMAVITELSGVPAIVVTLGASFIWLGAGLLMQSQPGGSSPDWLREAVNLNLPGVPLPIYVCAVLAVLTWWLLRRWRYGVALRGFGNNKEAFRDSGRSPLRARVSLYIMAGVCVVLAGAVSTANSGGSDIHASSTLTLTGVAAVIIGGAEFVGGVVEPIGAIVGAVAFGLLPSLLFFLDIPPALQTAVQGILLIAAMVIRFVIRRRSAR